MKIKYLSDKVRAIKALWFRKYYVVLDGRANSVTLSKSLYHHMTAKERPDMFLIVFEANDTKQYSFAFRSDFEQLLQAKTYFCELQYNAEHNKVGFRTDNPSVTGILANYGLPTDKMVRLSVLPRKTANGQTFYEIQRPN